VANDDDSIVPPLFNLNQNYPNPFNPETMISFSLSKGSDITLEVYNLRGQKIRTLHQGLLPEGMHELTWNGKDDNGNDTASGVYMYRLSTDGFTDTRKMVLMK
jgi:flagellar hook assembly protein FlgD